MNNNQEYFIFEVQNSSKVSKLSVSGLIFRSVLTFSCLDQMQICSFLSYMDMSNKASNFDLFVTTKGIYHKRFTFDISQYLL